MPNSGRPNEPQTPAQAQWKTLATALLALALVAPAVAALVPVATSHTDFVDGKLLAQIQAAPSSRFDAFLTLDHVPTLADANLLQGAGLTVGRLYPFPVVAVAATGANLLRATNLPGVLHVHGNDVLHYFGNTATVSTRARDVWDTKSTSTSPVTVSGTAIDGSGIGVAIIDSGIDATHPDLAGAVVANLKYVCTTPGLTSTATNTCYGNAAIFGPGCSPAADVPWLALPDTDSTSGHGTHVAGIVAGRGTVSAGRFMGVAPGANLIGLGTGEGLSILFAMEAFSWIACHHAAYNIKVISNSWGPAAGPYVATDPINVAVNAMVAADITVLFAAGNDGATSANTLSPYARNPTAGVIAVASSYDGDHGSRATSTVSTFSSRCLSSSAADDCPDVAAPGENIMSTQGKTGPVVLALGAGRSLSYLPYYSAIDGTSMATPHVAGIVALLKQADPSLTPAQIEDALEDNAVQFEPAATYSITDAANPTTTMSPNSGHGLVDAVAALEDVLATSPLGSAQPQVSQNPHVYLTVAGAGADPEVVGGLQWSVPDGSATTLAERSLTSGDAAWPLTAGTTLCRFVVFTPASGTATVPCSGAGAAVAADTAPAVRMDAAYTFSGTGVYTVEPQIDFGSGYVAIDSFQVTSL